MLQPVTPPLPDAILVGQNKSQYRVLHLLGQGGAGSVFKAIQQSTGQLVALKLLHTDEVTMPPSNQGSRAKSERMALRFEREMRLCAQLHHPNIVNLLDKGEDDNGQLFAVFEYIPGETLRDLLTRKGSLSALEAGDLMGQVLDALGCAHAHGIVHRDLKPHNIMISTTGARRHVKVLDFGIAGLVVDMLRSDYRNLTLTQESMCSPAYSAPEQLRGEPPTVKMDLYAWGLLFLECLTGQPAIAGSTVAEVFHKQLSSVEVPIPTALLGHPLAELLRRALRKNPQERSANASLLYRDFQKINLASIVGSLSQCGPTGSPQSSTELTLECIPGWFGMDYERQQITVLCCSLSVQMQEESIDENDARSESTIDMLDTLQRDQSRLCIDIAQRYGAHLVGTLGNSLMFYFGYPHATGDDARRAARTALELTSQVQRRNPQLADQGIHLDIRIGINTGMMRVMPGHVPGGVTPNLAWQLERLAKAGEVLVSPYACKLLDQYAKFESIAWDHSVDSPHSSQSTDTDSSSRSRRALRMLSARQERALSLLRDGAFEQSLQGRELEWAQLSQSWAAVKSGCGQTVLLRGEAGIGKSRLAAELCRAAGKNGAFLREWRCLPEHQNNALYPVLEMIKTQLHLAQVNEDEAAARVQKILLDIGYKICGDTGEETGSGSNIAATLPILCSWLSLPTPTNFPAQALSSERQKGLLLDALRKIIFFWNSEDFSVPSTAGLLIVEDLHWIDQTSLELLTSMIDVCPNYSMMLLLTARPDFNSPWQAGVWDIALGRLSETATHRLINQLLAGKSIAPAASATLTARLSERADGIPLFIEELMRMLLEQRILFEQDGMYQLDDHFEDTDLPITLRHLLASRLSRLKSSKETAQIAAALGREFEYPLLLAVRDSDEARLQDDLKELLAGNLIYQIHLPTVDANDVNAYAFRHALIRDAAYESMGHTTLQATHRRVVKVLHSHFPARVQIKPAEIARHCAGSGDFAQAVEYGLRATRYFYSRFLNKDALQNANQTLQWNRQRPAEANAWHDELQLNNVMIPALMVVGGYGDIKIESVSQRSIMLEQKMRTVRENDPLAMENAKAVEEFDHDTHHTQWALTQYQHMRSNRGEARKLAEHLVEHARHENHIEHLVDSLPLLGLCLATDGDPRAANLAYQEAIQHYDRVRDQQAMQLNGIDPLVHALSNQAMAHVVMGHAKAAYASMERAHDWASQIAHLPSIAICHIYDAQVCFLAQGDALNTMETEQQKFFAAHPELAFLKQYSKAIFDWSRGETGDQVEFSHFRLSSAQNYLHSLYEGILIDTHIKQGNYQKAGALLEAVLAWCLMTGEKAFLNFLHGLQEKLCLQGHA